MKYLLSALLLLSSSLIVADAVKVSHDAFKKLQQDLPKLKVLDVRAESEYSEGHIEGAINAPHEDIEKILSSVNKEDTIVMYCRSGRRAGIVAEMLEEKGYKNLFHLDGDMRAGLRQENQL